MDENENGMNMDRRNFFRVASAGLAVAGVTLTPAEQALAQFKTDKDRLARIASCTWPIRSIFKQRPFTGGGRGGGGRAGAPAGAAAGSAPAGTPAAGAPPAAPAAGRGGETAAPVVQRSPSNGGWTTEQMKEKYGEITMLDFPQFTKDTFPGVTHMDLFSGLFGDVTDDSMFAGRTVRSDERLGPQVARPAGGQDGGDRHEVPAHLQQRADQSGRPGRGGAQGRRRDRQAMARGLRGARREVDADELARPALGPSIRPNAIPRGPGDGYPRNVDIVPMLNAAIESYKEMADFGGNLGIKVTIENHWGLAADPMNIRIILDEVNHPYCEASPDFCNWEHEYMLFHGLKALAPYADTNVHAKYWDRWGDKNDVQRSVRIMLAGGFKGTFALEYEEGPLNGVEGAKYLYKEVLAALTTPAIAV